MRLFAQFVGTLLVVGLMLKYWWLIALVILAVVAWRSAPGLYARHREAAAAGQRRRARLAADADQQHSWVLAGDDRGVFGLYPPSAI